MKKRDGGTPAVSPEERKAFKSMKKKNQATEPSATKKDGVAVKAAADTAVDKRSPAAPTASPSATEVKAPTASPSKPKKQKKASQKESPAPKEKETKKLRPTDPETLLWLSILAGIVAIILFLILSSVTQIAELYIGIGIAIAYGVAVTAIMVRSKFTARQYADMQATLSDDSSILSTLLNKSSLPVVMIHDDGTILWFNNAFRDLLQVGDVHLFRRDLNLYCPVDIKDLKAATENPSEPDRIAIAKSIKEGKPPVKSTGNIHPELPRTVNGTGGLEYVINGRRFLVRTYSALFSTKAKDNEPKNYNLLLFEESTELMDLKDKLRDDSLTVAYIVLDNLADLARYARIDYRTAANNIEVYLKEWAAEIGGIFCEYDRDKYLLMLTNQKLDECIAAGFPILEKIRDEKLGDGTMSISVSMGISSLGASMSQREENAQDALENALRRGGDQVVIKTKDGLDCLGGRTKTVQKSENVASRVNAKLISDHIKDHRQIMIMGHKNPDCDSVGACIGMARFAMLTAQPDASIRVVVNTQSPTFRTCTAALRDFPEYKNVFIDAAAALDLVTSDTLLIVVDANNFNIIESSDIARSLNDIIIIDHHRKAGEYARRPLHEYIEPAASSASELITEMLDVTFNEAPPLRKEEANVLLAGIMLDTMNFTRSAGMRTFSTAYFLRSLGASSEQTREFFEDPLDQHLSEATFFLPGNVTIYRERIAIAVSMGTNPAYDRVAAAKASEKLISTQGIEAAFSLAKIGESIIISARSTGKINVQLILERLHGGGHFDAAGAQVNGKTMNEVLVLLKSAINHYFDDNNQKGTK